MFRLVKYSCRPESWCTPIPEIFSSSSSAWKGGTTFETTITAFGDLFPTKRSILCSAVFCPLFPMPSNPAPSPSKREHKARTSKVMERQGRSCGLAAKRPYCYQGQTLKGHSPHGDGSRKGGPPTRVAVRRGKANRVHTWNSLSSILIKRSRALCTTSLREKAPSKIMLLSPSFLGPFSKGHAVCQ